MIWKKIRRNSKDKVQTAKAAESAVIIAEAVATVVMAVTAIKTLKNRTVKKSTT